jgi:hypothetical protein
MRNDAGTGWKIDTRLTQPRSPPVHAEVSVGIATVNLRLRSTNIDKGNKGHTVLMQTPLRLPEAASAEEPPQRTQSRPRVTGGGFSLRTTTKQSRGGTATVARMARKRKRNTEPFPTFCRGKSMLPIRSVTYQHPRWPVAQSVPSATGSGLPMAATRAHYWAWAESHAKAFTALQSGPPSNALRQQPTGWRARLGTSACSASRVRRSRPLRWKTP